MDFNGSDGSEPEQLRKMFLGGLSFDTTEESIQDYFKQFGEITDCCVVRHKQGDRKPRGFGFVTFASSKNVEKVIAAKKDSPHTLDGREIDVKRALSKDDGGPKEPVTKAYVGGLGPETTEDDLRKYFSQYGTVTEVAIPKKPGEEKKRHFGFVTFEDSDSVDTIIILKNHHINDRSIEVKKALPKDSMRGDRFGRGGGRGGRGRGRGDYGGGYGNGGGRYQSGGYGGGGGGYGGGQGGGYGGGSYNSGYGGSGYDNSGGSGYSDFGSGYGQQSSGYGPMKSGGGGGSSSGGGSGGYNRNAPYSGYGGSSSGGGYSSGGGGSGSYSSGGGGGSSYGGSSGGGSNRYY